MNLDELMTAIKNASRKCDEEKMLLIKVKDLAVLSEAIDDLAMLNISKNKRIKKLEQENKTLNKAIEITNEELNKLLYSRQKISEYA